MYFDSRRNIIQIGIYLQQNQNIVFVLTSVIVMKESSIFCFKEAAGMFFDFLMGCNKHTINEW